ncbi:MAG TPA: hypothetical protein VG269_17400 [Tepidisphaeraceae bacterium]|nr:hypothetical protein [Tepidisphaeraceae bacterium]
MSSPLDHLQPIEGLAEFAIEGLSQPWGSVYSTGTYGEHAQLDGSIRTAAPIHYCRDTTGIKSMAKAIGELPSAKESLHLWIGGQHSMGHILPAVLELAAPTGIDECHIATLTFSKENANEWASLFDAKQVKKLTVLCSHYFSKTSTAIYDYARDLFEPRGIKMFAIRSHTKLLCCRLSDGRTVTAEGSANTRSAKTVEQVCIFGSRDVYGFHVSQMQRA